MISQGLIEICSKYIHNKVNVSTNKSKLLYDDFIKLSDNSQHFIKMVLAFFAASDTIVNMNLGKRFINEVTILEAQICYQFQTMIENIILI